MLASTDDALGSLLEGGSERRRVMRRVGQSQHMRRLRRGNTLTTPSGHDAVDVPVSQGLLRLDSSDDACVSHAAEPLEIMSKARVVLRQSTSKFHVLRDHYAAVIQRWKSRLWCRSHQYLSCRHVGPQSAWSVLDLVLRVVLVAVEVVTMPWLRARPLTAREGCMAKSTCRVVTQRVRIMQQCSGPRW